MAEETHEVEIRVGQFVYYRDVPDHRNPGKTILKADVARRGETVTVNQRDYEKGMRLGAFVGSVEETEQSGEPEAPDGFSASEAGLDEIAAHIEENKLNVADTVALAGDDPDVAERVLEAERQVATDNDAEPRQGVVDGLSKVIGGN